MHALHTHSPYTPTQFKNERVKTGVEKLKGFLKKRIKKYVPMLPGMIIFGIIT